MTRPICVLVGAPGAGKTTVGGLVAATLHVPYRDTDEVIETNAGKTVSDIFIEDGEDTFRAMERAAVADALETFDGVLGLGGGAILADVTRSRLRGHRVVYLSVEFADAASRVGLGATRPLLAVNPRATLRHLLEQRRPLYEQVATLTVVTDQRTPDEIAEQIVASLPPPAP
jgi:shikimate kinase